MFENFEKSLTDFIARMAPWLTPIPTAYLTARATMHHLAWPLALAVIAGAIIECLGLAAVNTLLDLYNYNREKRKSDPTAPMLVALLPAAVYFLAVTGLTVMLDTVPNLAAGAPLVFVVLSMAAVLVIALRADHRRRLAVIEADRAERRAERSGRRSSDRLETGQMTGQATGQVVSGDRSGVVVVDHIATGQDGGLTAVNVARRASREQAVTDMLAYLSGHPDASFSEAGRAVGRSKSWAIGALGDLETAGRVHRNGNGWEVNTE